MTRPGNFISGFNSLNRSIRRRLIQSIINVEEAHVILAVIIAFPMGGVPLVLYALNGAAAWH